MTHAFTKITVHYVFTTIAVKQKSVTGCDNIHEKHGPVTDAYTFVKSMCDINKGTMSTY